MRELAKLAVTATFLLAAPMVATAQAPAPVPGTGRPPSPLFQQRTTKQTKPLFSLFGLPVGIDAPVASPYCNCIYDTFAGQPMRSRSAVAAEGSAPGALNSR